MHEGERTLLYSSIVWQKTQVVSEPHLCNTKVLLIIALSVFIFSQILIIEIHPFRPRNVRVLNLLERGSTHKHPHLFHVVAVNDEVTLMQKVTALPSRRASIQHCFKQNQAIAVHK